MFFVASKVLSVLINPMVWIFGLILMGVFAKRNSLQKIGQIGGAILLIIFTSPILSNLALKKLEWTPKGIDEVPLIETAVVLGGMVTFQDFTDQLQLNGNVERIEEAINLYHEKIISTIILSGGSGSVIDPNQKEAKALEAFITKRGVKSKRLLLEVNSRNTFENAVNTSKLLDSLGMADQPIMLITSAFHMNRAVRCFQKQGVNIIPFPVDFKHASFDWSPSWLIPSATAMTTWEIVIREGVGILVYKITGYA